MKRSKTASLSLIMDVRVSAASDNAAHGNCNIYELDEG